MIADDALAIIIKGRGKPHRSAIRQRAEASIDMIKTRIDQLDRDDQAAEHVGDRAMGVDIGAEFVAAKKRIACKKRVTFPFEV